MNRVGKTVSKYFKGYGTFMGKIVDLDENEDKYGHQLFHVQYEDGDQE